MLLPVESLCNMQRRAEAGGVGGRERHLLLAVDRSDVDLVDLVTGDSAATGASCVQGLAVFAALGRVTSASLASTLRKSVTTVSGENNRSGRSSKSRFLCGCCCCRFPLCALAAAAPSFTEAQDHPESTPDTLPSARPTDATHLLATTTWI